MNIIEIEQGLVSIMEDTAKRLRDTRAYTNKERTRVMFTDLTKFFYNNYKTLEVWTCPNDTDHTINGWLFDFTVCDGRTPDDIDKILVALESEWNADFKEIKYDFYKLVQSRALLRVMVFQADDVNQSISDLIKIVAASQMSVSGDRYLFAGWSWGDKNGFTFKPYVKD
jgi:hypothetical protein